MGGKGLCMVLFQCGWVEQVKFGWVGHAVSAWGRMCETTAKNTH